MEYMFTIAATVIENISDIHKNFEKNDEKRIQTKTKLMELQHCYDTVAQRASSILLEDNNVAISLTSFVGMTHAHQNY